MNTLIQVGIAIALVIMYFHQKALESKIKAGNRPSPTKVRLERQERPVIDLVAIGEGDRYGSYEGRPQRATRYEH